MRSERTEMAFKERIFTIIKFPDTLLLIIYFSRISPKIWLKSAKSLLSGNSWKCPLQAKFKVWENSAWKKFSLLKQVPPPNAFMEN